LLENKLQGKYNIRYTDTNIDTKNSKWRDGWVREVMPGDNE
jgi:hypothetical protein